MSSLRGYRVVLMDSRRFAARPVPLSEGTLPNRCSQLRRAAGAPVRVARERTRLASRFRRDYCSAAMASVLDTTELIDSEDQTTFNLAVWQKVLTDSFLAGLPHRI